MPPRQNWKKYRAAHPCNQFLIEKFMALKRSADVQKLENQSACYAKIVISLDKYPLPIICMEQALTLEGVGTKMATLIKSLVQQRYKAYLTDSQHDQFHNVVADEETCQLSQTCPLSQVSELKRIHSQPVQSELRSQEVAQDSQSTKPPSKAFKLKKESSAYFFMSLLAETTTVSLSKKTIKTKIQQKFGHAISHWIFVKSLESSLYIQRTQSGYSLLEKGTQALMQLNKLLEPKTRAYHSILKMLESRCLEVFVPQKRDRTVLKKSDLGKFKLVLIVDSRQVRHTEFKEFFNQKLIETYQMEIKYQNISLGDFLWVIESEHFGELVLDYIIERKISSDLASSIIDGRYKQQRFRLNKCSISNVMYIYQGKPSHNSPLSEAALSKALRSIQFRSNFKVHRTTDINHTLRYLCQMHKYIQTSIDSSDEVVTVSTLGKFNSKNSKSNVPVNCVLGLMLKCIPGVGRQTVEYLVSKFKSMRDLYLCLKQLPPQERLLLMNTMLQKRVRNSESISETTIKILFPDSIDCV